MNDTLNPYEAPQGDLGDSSTGYGDVKLLKASGRIGRVRYLAHAMLLGLIGYAIMLPGVGLIATGNTALAIVGGLIAVGGYIFIFYASIVCGIQRLHDLNQSGWLILLMFIPIANIVLIIFMLFVRGTQGVNKWGNPPPPNKTWNIVLACIFPVFTVVGILAAIALPAYQSYTERAQQAEESVDWSE